MSKYTLPSDRRTELANWLTTNGIDPADVLVDADLTIIDTDNGRAIHYEKTVRDANGRIQADERGDHVATEMCTVPLQTEPPRWWTPYVKPTREQLLAAEARVRTLHRRNEHSGVCEHCSEHDYPDYAVPWPCPTIRALDGEPADA